MANKNILIMSAGRRVELVEIFKLAAQKKSPGSKVFTTDMLPGLAPACEVSDGAIAVSRVTDDGYIDSLKQICVEYEIGLLVPTIDTELLLLSSFRDEFENIGANIVISSRDLIGLCRDKRKTASLFEQLDIDRPEIYSRDSIVFPCFCKPYDGSCSIGAKAIQTSAYLTQELLDDEKNIFMELIGSDYKEVTVDVYFDRDGRLSCLVPRERIEVRAGEVSKGVTRRDFLYDYLLSKLGGMQGARGCITVQVFFDKKNNSVKGLEINPRFGGGYPLTDAVGAHYPEWLINEYLLQENVPFFDVWEADVIMLRYDAKVLVRENNY